ncbi:MAG: hypothetical protein ACRC8J_02955 [Phocaeicola sp.]
MIQRLLILCCLFSFSFIAFAQKDGMPNRDGKGFSKEEFRNRQEAFLTEKAKLTKDEAAKFFPLYFELQDKKKELNDKAWKNARKGREDSTTEKEYEQIVEQVIKARLEADKLELDYFKKYKTFLSAKKIYQIQMGEIRFQRDILKAVSGERPQPHKPSEIKK